MAKKVVGREMTSKVGLDSAEAVKSLKTLTAEVKANTSGWKAQETALKSAGEYQKAAAARVDGLAKSMESQKAKIDELKSRQSGLNRDTKDGEEQYLKLSDQINKASRSYDSMGGQLDRAKSKLQYYNSGLADLQKGYKQSTALSESYVKRLEAEGKQEDANKARLSGLKQAYSNIEAQYKAQTNELDRIKTASGATSDAYKRQQVRVNETATSMAKLKSETNELDSAMNKSNASAFTKMLDKAKSKLGMVRSEEEKTKSETKHFAIGSAIGYSISSAASSTVGYIKEVTKQGYELAEAGGTIKKQWTNLGLSDADATKMTAQIGDIRSKANISGGAIDQMQKKFYAMTNSTTKARAMTEVIASYGSAAGKSGDQIASMSQGIGKLSGSAKVTASLFKRSFSQVPELQKAVIKASGMSTDAFNKQLAAGKITGTQLQGYMVKAAKTSGKAWSEFGDTTKGKMAAIQGTYTNLKVAFAKPLVAGVEKAIDGVSKKKGALDDVKKSLTGLVGTLGKKTGQYVGDAISFLVKNEKSIEKTGGAIASIVGSLAKGAWSAVASALKLIGGHSKDASKGMNGIADATQNIAKHKGAIQTLGKVIITSFALSKLKGIASGFLGIGRGIGKTISFVTSLSKAQRAAAKATNTQTAAQKLLDIAMDANPIALVVTAIAALSVGFYEAYKHIKPFRDAVNGMGTAMKKLFIGKYGWEKSIGKKLAGVGSTISKWGKGAGKFVSKHKSEILAGLVSPFAGLSAWFLKDTKTGKNVQKWAKGFSKDIKKMGLKKAMDKQVNDASKAFKKSKFGKWFNNIGSSFNSFKKSFKKTWNKHWSDTGKTLKRDWNGSIKDTRNFFSSFGKKWDTWKSSWKKSWSSHWSSNGRTLKTNWNTSFKLTKSFFSSMGTKWAGWKKSWSHSWNNHWDTMRANLHSYWNKDLSHTKVFGHSMSDWLGAFKKSFKSGWSGLGTGVENIFKGLWKDLKGFAKDGMNDVIDIINGGINAVDSVIHTFGGKKKTIGDLSHVHFATGTGMFSGSRNPITKPTLAMLNDGHDSPETGNKEMVMLPNGDSGIVQGRNTKMMLPAGTEVLNASETAMLMSMQGVTKYAKGTGIFGDILNSVTSGISGVTSWVGKKVGSLEKFFNTATNIIAHPVKSLENLFSWSSKGVSGVMSNIGHGLFNGVENQAKTWWSTLWGGVSDSLDSGASSSTLVNAMEKYGATNKYVYGAEGPSAFDCSGLVEYTLKKLGISFPRTSGEQYKASKHVSNPKPGDLVFFGPGGSEHVGVYTGNGEFYSAENEKDGMGISKVHGGGYGTFAGYGRVPGLSDSTSSDKSSKSSGLLSTIKKQVGSGFWKFISKLADEFGDGGSSNPGGSGVQRWKPDVIKALKKNGFEASASQVSAWMKVIARESNGDPTVVNNWDSNAKMGIPSMGLVQTIRPTFEAYKFPGHNNILNGYDDLLAGIHYMKAKYGSGASAFARVSGPEGYENGGIINTNQLIEVAEHNKPEMVLPLTNKSRANQLIAQASQVVNGNTSTQVASTNSESNEKLDKLISLMSAILGNMGSVQAVIAKSDVVNAVKSDNKTASQYSQMMGY
ncbi:NlpC/P60 family protein [Lactiplantibacillus plantarum]|uniref:NlpC/P60 family protein n=1 Tax=Lactiplantibacillus plantarum TaxID=1590 RepID=UPI000B3E739C|nr:NlpC/P60 family protein [Lactiplantibacillus plantarum]ARW13434.1 putative endopeptidase p60 [Lactiplantibacillus plantarum subsp. plantarum]QHM23502.1 putative endopeptidase p60 [Lactiplantibacillus plantarum]QHM23560.1 putative endopeptidase p60 [Lactiplantibacillus plantarum]QHM29416.1 putative endopeptidase p60 [Lactiplantibacillus plantarum]